MPNLPSRRVLTAIDVAVAGWVVLCVVLGLRIAAELREVRSVTDTLATTGQGLERAGEAVGKVPRALAGEEVAQLGADAREAGAQAQASARDSRDSITAISTLTAVTLATVPTLAVLFLYVPLRIALGRATGRASPRRTEGSP